MNKIKKAGIAIILLGVCFVAGNIIYLFSLTPKENYPDDTYLESEKNKTALIVVAHDDDATVFAGTTSKLAEDGWEISFLCFYPYHWRPEDNPIRKIEMEKWPESKVLKILN